MSVSYSDYLSLHLCGFTPAVSSEENIFDDTIFTSPVLIDMHLTIVKNLNDEVKPVKTLKGIIKTAYLSENSWYYEYSNIVSDPLEQRTEKRMWDGSVLKQLIFREHNSNFRPTFFTTEENKPSLGSVNPLVRVYGSLGKPYILNKINDEQFKIFNAESLGLTFDAVLHKNKGLTSQIEYFNENGELSFTILFSDYNLQYKGRNFPSKITYDYNSRTYEYRILDIMDIEIDEYAAFDVLMPEGNIVKLKPLK